VALVKRLDLGLGSISESVRVELTWSWGICVDWRLV